MITASIVVSLVVVYCFSLAMIDNYEKINWFSFAKALLIIFIFGMIEAAIIDLMILMS